MTTMSKTWSEPTVLALMRKHRGLDPEEIIERHAERCLREGKQDQLPIDVEGVASLHGIRSRLGDHPFAGRIYVEPSGQLVMDLNASDSPPRRRFTCGHELIHTAFPGFERARRYRSDDATGTYDPRREEEYLCDRGAAALLMPRSLVRSGYSLDEGLSGVERLAADGVVSLEAAANRLVELADSPVAMLLFGVMNKPADRSRLRRGDVVAPRLRVRYARTQDLDVYIPRYKSAADDTPFTRSLESRDVERGVTYIPGAERHGKFDIEAKSYPWIGPNGRVERVIALARPY
jgi:IrrE N-terminal-like domain